MQSDSQQVDAEPRHHHHDDQQRAASRQAERTDHLAHPGVDQDRAPQHDQQRAVLLRIPAPEPAPRLVRPDAAEHGAHEREGESQGERPEHGPVGMREPLVVDPHPAAAALLQNRLHHVHVAEQAGHAARHVAGGDHRDVGGQPEVGVQHRLQHRHRVRGGELARQQEEHEAAGQPAEHAEVVLAQILHRDAAHRRAPAHEHESLEQVGNRRPVGDQDAQHQTEGVGDQTEHQQQQTGPVQPLLEAQERQGQQQQPDAVRDARRQVGIGAIEQNLQSRVLDLQLVRGAAPHRVGELAGGQSEAQIASFQVGHLQVAQRQQLAFQGTALFHPERRGLLSIQRLPRRQPPNIAETADRNDRQRQADEVALPGRQTLAEPQQQLVGAAERAGGGVRHPRGHGRLAQLGPPQGDVEIAVDAGAGQPEQLRDRRIVHLKIAVRIGERER